MALNFSSHTTFRHHKEHLESHRTDTCEQCFPEHTFFRRATRTHTGLTPTATLDYTPIEIMSTFGQYFRVTTYGESHGKSVGCIVDGVPPGLELTEKDIQPQMTRRRPGQSALTTPRDEKDMVEIQSGTEFGITLGTPIGLRVMNQDQRPKDYGKEGASFNGQQAGTKAQRPMDDFPRPSHADWTYLEKYGVKASSGGGRSSARETIGRVAAAAIAEKYLKVAYGVEIVAFTNSVGNEHLFPSTRTHPSPSTNPEFLNLLEGITREQVDSFLPVRCPNGEAAKRMEDLIAEYRDKHDSIGGTVTCVIRNCPSGLGEPCFDKMEVSEKSFSTGSVAAIVSFIGSTGHERTMLKIEETNGRLGQTGACNAEYSCHEKLRDWLGAWRLRDARLDTQRSFHQGSRRGSFGVRSIATH